MPLPPDDSQREKPQGVHDVPKKMPLRSAFPGAPRGMAKKLRRLRWVCFLMALLLLSFPSSLPGLLVFCGREVSGHLRGRRTPSWGLVSAESSAGEPVLRGRGRQRALRGACGTRSPSGGGGLWRTALCAHTCHKPLLLGVSHGCRATSAGGGRPLPPARFAALPAAGVRPRPAQLRSEPSVRSACPVPADLRGGSAPLCFVRPREVVLVISVEPVASLHLCLWWKPLKTTW